MCGLKCVIEIDASVSLLFSGKRNSFSVPGGSNVN